LLKTSNFYLIDDDMSNEYKSHTCHRTDEPIRSHLRYEHLADVAV
jgi:hypothetical protein